MNLSEQESGAAKKHNSERMQARGETCIDCHKGIGHGLPPGYE
jgi:nitrate/TMAO reductase-like tetraheme cytochrome c subunit